jgi:hypothetical protein
MRMESSGGLNRVALVRTDVSEEPGASFVRVTKIVELRTTKAATSNRRTLRRNTILHEECRLLGHKNPVRTSQETHYVSITEPSQLMVCKI